MARALIIRLLPLALIPIGAIIVVAAFAYVGLALWSTDDGGPTYRVENSRVVDDLDAIQQRLDFEIVEPPHELVPWPLSDVYGSTSNVAYWYRSDEGLALQIAQRRVERPGAEAGELMVNGVLVHRVVNEEFGTIVFHWLGCDLVRFEVFTDLGDEDVAIEVVRAMVEQCA